MISTRTNRGARHFWARHDAAQAKRDGAVEEMPDRCDHGVSMSKPCAACTKELGTWHGPAHMAEHS